MKLNYSGNGYSLPFPHYVIDHFISEQDANNIVTQWPRRWVKEKGRFQIKWSSTNLPKYAMQLVDSIDVSEIEAITGIDGLFKDPDLFGAGLHCIPKGGFLNMHCDFNIHPKGWRRRVNVLVYLNQGWRKEWGGDLALSDMKSFQVEYAPKAGRCVIFETNDHTWHGHPNKLNCPDGVYRKSLAVYLYTQEDTSNPHSTLYRKSK